jgi:protein dithiol:quinone oxidoreductase
MRSDRLLLGAALAGLAAVAFAVFTQLQFDMRPCPWCVLQRALFLAVAVAALVGLALRRLGAALVLLLAGCGMAAALWQHFVAAKSDSCRLTLADKLMSGAGLDRLWPQVFQAQASCADASTPLLGVPYEFWSLALFFALAVVGLRVLRRPAG